METEYLELALRVDARWKAIESAQSLEAELHLLTQQVVKIGRETQRLLQRLAELETHLHDAPPRVRAALRDLVVQTRRLN